MLSKLSDIQREAKQIAQNIKKNTEQSCLKQKKLRRTGFFNYLFMVGSAGFEPAANPL